MVATSQTQPVQMQELLNGDVHNPAVEKSTEPTDLTWLEKVPNSDKPSKSVVCSEQSLTAEIQSYSSQGESKEFRPGHKPLRRSKSAGQPPLTPSRRIGTTGNSKSCPPTRLKASPAKEVIKHSGKARNEQVGTGETVKGGTSERKGKHGQPPLRRAGMDTTRKLSFFSKSNGTACQSRGPFVGEEKLEGDVYMIDVQRLIAADELRKQAVAVEQIRDAGSKWLTQSPEAQRNEIERLAVSFLLAMNSTLCFFTVAMRMLSKAPWTDPMITPDVRQAAMVAISRGWFVKSENFTKYPFTRAELALAAGAYRGLLVPTIPDDTTVALRTIIDHLPHACATMFTQAEVACPFCQAKRKGVVPTFSCSTTWKQSRWANLKTALEQAQPFLGYIPKGWHREGCDRDDQCPTVTKLGKWLYLELRPYPVLDNDFFSSLKETASLLVDESLCEEGLCVDSLVCSNLGAGEGRHYWLVEIKEGRMHQAYDSLQGVQPLTQEVFKMLQVTGILLRAAGCSKPTLRNSQLDRLAGKVDTVQRRQQTIRVASRSRTHKLRNQLVKSMSNLTLAPLKRGLRPSQVQLERATSGDVLCAVPCVAARRQTLGSGVRSCKARKSRKRKGTTKNNARGRSMSQVLPFCNTTNRGKVSVPVCQDQGSAQQEATAAGRWNKDRHDGEETAVLSDPISETFTQPQVLPESPSRDRKRTYAQAELEQESRGQTVNEDEARRNQGPPSDTAKAYVAADTGEGRKEATKASGGGDVESVEHSPQINPPLHAAHQTMRTSVTDDGMPEPPGSKVEVVSGVVDDVIHPSTPGTARCRVLPVDPEKNNNQGEQGAANSAAETVKGRYGVISLFDGVSTVLPILSKKFGYPPVAAIIAECDLSLRELVCAEYGYRSDEKWGYTAEGTAVLYLKDVHEVINRKCQVLQDLVQMFPDCKWIIVGGSPCQDLTFAGPLRGMLGLVGPNSRLFFVLLCVISTMQKLAGTNAVRYLVENAASMLHIHLEAFCRLLGLPVEKKDKYVWDPCEFGFQITRKRNYFRNFDDVEAIDPPAQVFGQKYGPLIDQGGHIVPFAPLLRTRESLPFGMLRASWTLYQPHALVWDYGYWNGKTSFAKACKLGANKIPHLNWEQIIPPPFLKAWYKFLQACESRCVQGKEIDEILSPLLPLFHSKSYSTPFRILTEEEVAALSGLHGAWTRISPQDAEALPEKLIRDYCGNCFHPALISSALGNNEVLRGWATGVYEGPEVLVAGQSEAFQVFAHLCDQVDVEAKRKLKKEKIVIDRTLPAFQVLELSKMQQIASHGVSEKPEVLPPSITGCRKVRVTKAEKHIQHCIDAALHKLEEYQCEALRKSGLERVFDGLRATCFVPCQLTDYSACLIGEDLGRLRQFAARFPQQCPSIQCVEDLRAAFQIWTAHPSLCTLIGVLIAGSRLKKDSSWPVGHVVLLPGKAANSVCYLGDATPKLLLLVNAARPQAPEIYVVEATAYRNALQFKYLPVACQLTWPQVQLRPDTEFNVELRDGQGILNVGSFHCQQEGCLTCFLADCLQLAFCPWHLAPSNAREQSPLSVAHFLCTKNTGTSTIELVGQLTDTTSASSFHLFHVCTSEQIHQLGLRSHLFQRTISLFHSSLSEAVMNEQSLLAMRQPFSHTELPPEFFRHLFVKAGGPASAFDVWLQERSLEK